MIEDVEVAHYTHLSLTQYVTASDYAALREELRKYKEEDDVWMKSSLVDLSKDRDRLREELAQVTHDYAQIQEAYNAKAAGVPLGPIVGAQTILNQQRHIATLQARLAELEPKP